MGQMIYRVHYGAYRGIVSVASTQVSKNLKAGFSPGTPAISYCIIEKQGG